VIDDSDEPSRAATPLPPTAADEKKADNTNGQGNVSEDKALESQGANDEATTDKDQGGVADAPAARPQALKPQELSPEIRQKLRKLEKLEATYPGKPNTLILHILSQSNLNV
jgi:hypothetical protein